MREQSGQVLSAPHDVRRELAALGINPQVMHDVARAVRSARAGTLSIDAAGASGMFGYLHGVRALRAGLLVHPGWRMARVNNIEATVNDDLGIQLVYQNVDRACRADDPVPVSEKGPAACRLVAHGQMQLFASPANSKPAQLGVVPRVWWVCVGACEESLQAEVSCPVVEDGQLIGFSRRIWVVDEAFSPPPSREDDLEADDGFNFAVTRR